MKKKGLLAVILCFILVTVFSGCAGGQRTGEDTVTLSPDSGGIEKAETEVPAGSSLEGMTFNKIGTRERISLLLSEVPSFDVMRESDSSIILKLTDTIVSEKLRSKQGEGLLANVRYVLPMQKVVNGKTWVYVKIQLGEMVPYRVREDLHGCTIDFDVSSLPVTVAPMETKIAQEEKPAAAMKTYELVKKEEKVKPAVTGESQEVAATDTAAVTQYAGRRISLDLQNANIKGVLRLLSEVSGVNIVSGPDVKGTVTIYVKDVPWDQALDTILDLNGLAKKEMGSIISIMTLEKKQKDEQTRVDAEKSLVESEKVRKQRELELNAEQGKLRQIAIEAKIVEVSTNFAQEFGINWGAGYQSTWNDSDIGVMFGSADSGTVTSLPGGVGLTSSNVAVNFPSSIVTTPALGIVAGSASWILDAELGALESSGEGKIISSPKVTTLDNVQATIKQGEEIPYASYDSEGNRTISFKDAVLQLDVKPTITPEGKISMEIKATNDYADWNKTNVSDENPPIVTSNVESTVVVEDGDTIVVGGIFKTSEAETMSGIPFLSKIPILGWLFKYKTTTSEKRELLIFVTPRIHKGT